jgi:hypothetical protein
MFAYAHTDGPNQNRDVIVHFSERCESRNDCKAVWTVFLGASEQAEFEDQFEAMRFARSLADQNQLPAWLFAEGEGLRRLGN